MINGRNEQKQEASLMDGLSPLEVKGIEAIIRRIRSARADQLHGSLRISIGFRAGVSQNVEFDTRESMRVDESR